MKKNIKNSRLLLGGLFLAAQLIFTPLARADFNAMLVTPYDMQKYDQEIKRIYATNMVEKNKLVNQNMIKVAHYFLNRSFEIFALGEGPTGKYDQNPLYRTDLFDCQTFISTVLAMSESDDLVDFKKNIVAINYGDNTPDFFQRNHFIATQWNINNQRKGFVKDISKQIYPQAITVPVVINLSKWFVSLPAARVQSLKLLSVEQTQVLLQSLHNNAPQNKIIRATLTYIPRQVLLSKKGRKIIDAIPDGTIIEFISKSKQPHDYQLTPYHVTHFSLFFHDNKQAKLIYSSLVQRRVITASFRAYLERYRYIAGINLELPIAKA